MHRNIVLVGFMGTGKTSVGRVLADRLGWIFSDTDHHVEEKAGMPVSQIFAEQGEEAFRQLETEALQELLGLQNRIIATGGGAVLKEENRRLMEEGGLVVALNAAEEVIVERVREDAARPLLAGNVEERVRLLMEARRTAYAFAPVQLDTGRLTVQQAAERIIGELARPS